MPPANFDGFPTTRPFDLSDLQATRDQLPGQPCMNGMLVNVKERQRFVSPPDRKE